MDNLSNAILMGGSVLLFLIGISVSIFLYSKIVDTNSKILTTSEYYDRTAETFSQHSDEDVERIISGAEVCNQILEIARHSDDLTFKSITVDGKMYNYDECERLNDRSGKVTEDLQTFDNTIVENQSNADNLTTKLKGIASNRYKIALSFNGGDISAIYTTYNG